ncbi:MULTISPECIES: Rv3235 family protein [unclassified Nocardioides]|uniref:Rv3235 family protein n=1 Tax=unclassified Nocardioides TaxID=2615069 RepID=UPI00266534B5|nr:Rv3235 family protein [Nocardioides sp. Arc9.136]WKN47550.1 Rv3235 family protein [Nocardioides sp. Arc9.136]
MTTPPLDAQRRNVLRFPRPPEPTSVQGTLALDLSPRLDPPPAQGPDGATSAGVVPVDLRRRRGLEQWSRRFAQAAVEIVGGDRPVSQLLRWTSPEVYADLDRRACLVARAGGHRPGAGRAQPVGPKVLSVHSCFVSAVVVETSVHVRYGERSRALAVRFEERAGKGTPARWVCTALDFA